MLLYLHLGAKVSQRFDVKTCVVVFLKIHDVASFIGVSGHLVLNTKLFKLGATCFKSCVTWISIENECSLHHSPLQGQRLEGACEVVTDEITLHVAHRKHRLDTVFRVIPCHGGELHADHRALIQR